MGVDWTRSQESPALICLKGNTLTNFNGVGMSSSITTSMTCMVFRDLGRYERGDWS